MLSEIFNVEKVMSVCYTIMYFLVLNILFILCNIPLFVFVFGIGISNIGVYFPLFCLCLLPVGPSLCALFHCMNKLIKNKDIYPFKEYVKGYRKNFCNSVIISVIHIAAIFALVTNIRYFAGTGLLVVACLSIGVCLIVLLITPNLYLLTMKYDMKVREIIKAALTLTIAKPLNTLGNVAVLGIVLMFFELWAGTTFLFMASGYGFLIVFMNKGVLKQLEK